MTQAAHEGEIAAPGESRRWPPLRALAAETFGPRPTESALWGLGIGVLFGLPLILGYFIAHFVTLRVGLVLGNVPPSGDFTQSDYEFLLIAGMIVLSFAALGITGVSVLVSRLRRSCLGTMLLVAVFVSYIPYTLFYLLFVFEP